MKDVWHFLWLPDEGRLIILFTAKRLGAVPPALEFYLLNVHGQGQNQERANATAADLYIFRRASVPDMFYYSHLNYLTFRQRA